MARRTMWMLYVVWSPLSNCAPRCVGAGAPLSAPRERGSGGEGFSLTSARQRPEVPPECRPRMRPSRPRIERIRTRLHDQHHDARQAVTSSGFVEVPAGAFCITPKSPRATRSAPKTPVAAPPSRGRRSSARSTASRSAARLRPSGRPVDVACSKLVTSEWCKKTSGETRARGRLRDPPSSPRHQGSKAGSAERGSPKLAYSYPEHIVQQETRPARRRQRPAPPGKRRRERAAIGSSPGSCGS